jgi:hypothetical protein
LGRVNADGSLDPQFRASADTEVHGVVVQANGKIVVAGYFNVLNGLPHVRLGRLNWDGSLDPSLTVTVDRYVRAAALGTDGKILLGGDFSTLSGLARLNVGRIDADTSTAPIFIDTSSMKSLPGGELSFSFLNPHEVSLSVRGSDAVETPPAAWENLGAAVSLGGGIYQFTDPNASSHPCRFIA